MQAGTSSLPAQSVISLTVDDGLSQGYVASIACDEDGFVWAATLNGLNRYDGYVFHTWYEQKNEPGSLSSNFVTTTKSGKNGLIWMSTSKGLQLMNRKTGIIVTPECMRGSLESYFHTIFIDSKGDVWLTVENLLYHLILPRVWTSIDEIAEKATLRTVSTPPPFGRISSVIEYGKEILLTTDAGVFTFDPATDRYTPYLLFPAALAECAWTDSDFRQLFVRYENALYVLEDGALRSWPMEITVWNHGFSIVENAGKIFLLTPFTVYEWVDGHPRALPISLDAEIVSGAVDRFGQLWLGTNAKGIRIIKPKIPIFSSLLQGTSIGGAIFDTNDDIWVPNRVGNSQLTFSLIDKSTGKAGRVFTKQPYGCMFFSPRGGCYGLRKDGVLEYRNSDGALVKGSEFNIPSGILNGIRRTMLGMTQSGKLIITDEQGTLLLVDPGAKKVQVLHFRPEMVGLSCEIKAIAEDMSGYFWIGTSMGLIRLSPEGADMQVINTVGAPGKILSSEKINEVFIDPVEPDIVWVGTVSGLNRMNVHTGDITYFTQKDGLNDDYIYTILSGKPGELWLGTNHGLLCFNRITYQVVQYTVADGLPASEFNTGMAWQGKDSTLYFGTVGGVVFFNPFKMPVRKFNPDIRITGLEVNGRPLQRSDTIRYPEMVPYLDQLTLLHQENNLAFRFTVMDFFNIEKYNCRYMLIGADKDWRYTWSNNLITYANLAPGDYTFVVSAADGAGGWHKGRTLQITILSLWWKRWWAWLIWYALAGIAVWSMVVVRNRMTGMKRQMELERIEAGYRAALEENKTKMFVNIAHEIRTPLTILLGLTEEVQEASGPEVQGKIVLMRQSGQQLLNVVQQILNLIKLEERRLILNPHYGDLADFIRYTVEPFQPMLRKREITFLLNIPDLPVMMMFDPQYMQPVISNLLSNAVKFTSKGGTITFTLWQDTDFDKAGKVHISIQDTGIGIAPEYLSRIFDRYFQVEGTAAGASGTGIGLTYVSELIKLMEGSVTVESEVGAGSVFSITLPFKTGTAHQQAQQRWHGPPAAGSADEKSPATSLDGGNTQKTQVLIVEDNYEMAQFIMGCLTADYLVHHAINGKEGFEMARSLVPDLIITDVMMPEMNGYDFTAAVKNDTITNHIPVVILTARSTEADTIQGLRRGADVYLSKPFSQEILRLKLNNLISLRDRMQEKRVQTSNETVTDETAAETPEIFFVNQVYSVIAQHFADAAFGVDELCQIFNMSNSQFHRKVGAILGATPGHLIRAYRLERGRELLIDAAQLSVAEIAYSAGFNDPNYFSQAFSAAYGQSPRQYRQSIGKSGK